MTGLAERLAAMGRELPPASAPLANYCPAVLSGNLVFTAGQLPLVGGKLPMSGRVGAEVTVEQAAELAAGCALNAIAAACTVVAPDRLARVVKVVGYVASSPGFTGQPAVLNGASDLLAGAFAETGPHARSAVGVCVLPLDAPVEIEVVFEVRPAR